MFNLTVTILLFCCSLAMAAPTKILLIRHGETEWNVQNRAAGQADIPLNARGQQQALEVAQELKERYPELKAFYSSDLQRAMQTANACAHLFHSTVIPILALRELDSGEATGLTTKEILDQYAAKQAEMQKERPHQLPRWDFTAIPGQETYNQVLARVKPAIVELALQHPGETIALFGHSGVIRVILLDALQSKEDHYKIPNCGIIELQYDGEFKLFCIEKL
jgi:probable phosphoglycerate mutase